MGVAVILIELASSDLWRDHLRSSNFASCEEILSTEEGRRTTLKYMFRITDRFQPELCTPAKIITAIRRLEELQCPNTAELVILWAWTAGAMKVMGRGGWRSIERNTLKFYQTHGMRRLTTLSRHITDKSIEFFRLILLRMRHQGPPCRAGGVRQPASSEEAIQRREFRHLTFSRVAQACQLRRLYQLFGYDPMTWKEAVDTETGVFSGRSVTPQFTDWVCDYP